MSFRQLGDSGLVVSVAGLGRLDDATREADGAAGVVPPEVWTRPAGGAKGPIGS